MEELKKAIETANTTLTMKKEAVHAKKEAVHAKKEAVLEAEAVMFENPNKTTATAFKESKQELATAEQELATAEQELATAEQELATAEQELASALPTTAGKLVSVANSVATKELVKILLASPRANRGTAISIALAIQNPSRYTTPEALKFMVQDVNDFMRVYAPNNGEAIKGNCADHNTLRGAVTIAGLLAGLSAVTEETFTAKLTKE